MPNTTFFKRGGGGTCTQKLLVIRVEASIKGHNICLWQITIVLKILGEQYMVYGV